MTQPIVHMFPCLDDNFGLLLHDPASGMTATIDTPDADVILQQCEQKGWQLTHILNTHHHFDHTGGNLALAAKISGLKIVGSKYDAKRIPGITERMSEGDILDFGELSIEVFETSGHTIGHIIYYVPAGPLVFVGDTLFKMGCGRLFEGSAAQMYESIAKIASLPDETLVYCAHEYTLANGRFALLAEPDNDSIKQVMLEDIAKRDAGEATLPTSVGLEKQINPFMRARSAGELGELRAGKDNFRG